MTGAYGVEVVLFHQQHVFQHRFFSHSFTSLWAVIVTIYTLDYDGHTIYSQSLVRNTDGSDTQPTRLNILHYIKLIIVLARTILRRHGTDYQGVQVRNFS
jgi:hypothetical protein